MLAVPEGSREVREGGTRCLLQAAPRGAPAPESPSRLLRRVRMRCACAAGAPPGPRATGATIMTLHICLCRESHLWARRPSPRRCDPRPPDQVWSELWSGFHVSVWCGSGDASVSCRQFAGGPQRDRGFSALGTPARGRTKPSCPQVLSARPESCCPVPRRRPPPKMLSELLD